ncbi:MAG: spondin domain-containing protein [Pseudomonadota bacterium]
MRRLHLFGCALLCAALASPAGAVGLRVTVSNLASPGGFSLTPVYTAFHNGSVDLFDAGAAASDGIEEIAELGGFGGLTAQRLATQGDSQGAVVTAGAPPTIDPGETGVAEVDIADPAENRFFSFFSMIVPSNDTFFGNDDARGFALFGEDGEFLGSQTIAIGPAFIFDAGTEENDFSNGPAFVVGADATAGAETAGLITAATDEGLGLETVSLEGLTTPAGLFNPLFASVGGPVALITIEQIDAAVPLPTSALLFLTGIGGFVLIGRRTARLV